MIFLPKPTRIHKGALLRSLLASKEWTIEPKIDGVRCLITVSKSGNARAYSHYGVLRMDVGWLDELNLPCGDYENVPAMYDCELDVEEQMLWCFDRPDLVGPQYKRRERIPLESAHFRIIPKIEKSGGNELSRAIDDGYEGIVLKHVLSSYPTATRPCQKTSDWLKVKP